MGGFGRSFNLVQLWLYTIFIFRSFQLTISVASRVGIRLFWYRLSWGSLLSRYGSSSTQAIPSLGFRIHVYSHFGLRRGSKLGGQIGFDSFTINIESYSQMGNSVLDFEFTWGLATLNRVHLQFRFFLLQVGSCSYGWIVFVLRHRVMPDTGWMPKYWPAPIV